MVDDDKSQPIRELSPGEILLQARLQAGLTQEQVAKELYMTVYKVKALETDDYSRLSSDTFARGYIRAYANLVKIDVVAVLAAYDKLMDELRPNVRAADHAVTAPENGPRGTWQFLMLIGAFLLGLWLISVWFFDNRSEPEYPVSAASTSSLMEKTETTASSIAGDIVSVSSSIAGTELVAGVTKSATSGNSLSANNSSSNSSLAVGSSAVSVSSLNAQPALSTLVKKTALDEISFSFRGECWLEVSDSRGDVLATELEPAGGKITLLGVAPFDVKLGNAPVVDIQLNGKKVDVVPLIGSNVLILKVGN
ncbi:MAG: RodZ domain-containing protein [Cellvibrio sp.]